jgi:hypothetical protein
LQKQVDGVFCTDGMMAYDKDLARLIYLYRYRNQYIVMDSNLSMTYRANTIDTTSVAKVKVATIASTHAHTMAAPPLMVNRQMAVHQQWLFVNSSLLARNEHTRALDQASVIDVYDLLSRKYQFSFYLYDYDRREKIRQFAIYGNRLIALFETHISSFDLHPQYFLPDREQ